MADFNTNIKSIINTNYDVKNDPSGKETVKEYGLKESIFNKKKEIEDNPEFYDKEKKEIGEYLNSVKIGANIIKGEKPFNSDELMKGFYEMKEKVDANPDFFNEDKAEIEEAL